MEEYSIKCWKRIMTHSDENRKKYDGKINNAQ